MPCDSSHMEPTRDEIESKRVCSLLAFISRMLDREMPAWVFKGEADCYGDVDRLDEATAFLCEQLVEMSSKQLKDVVYDAYSRDARKLADWWEDHQVEDLRKKRAATVEQKNKALRTSGLAKLSKAEREALGHG